MAAMRKRGGGGVLTQIQDSKRASFQLSVLSFQRCSEVRRKLSSEEVKW
jgi:hypothetical protein